VKLPYESTVLVYSNSIIFVRTEQPGSAVISISFDLVSYLCISQLTEKHIHKQYKGGTFS